MERMHTSPLPRTRRHPVLLGLLEALRLDLIVVPAAFVVSTVFWIIGLGSQLPYAIIPEWALALWSAIHGLSVSALGFDFSLAPGLVTAGVWILVALGSRRLVETCGEDDAEDDLAEQEGTRSALLAVATFVVAYSGPLLVAALLAGEAAATPFGVLRLVMLLVSAALAGWLLARGAEGIPVLGDLAPETLTSALDLAKRLLWGLLGASVIVVGLAAALRWDDMAESMDAYSSPLSAGIGLLAVQILFAPGILLGALSFSAGTGVSLGAGGLSSVFSTAIAPVPDVPVLQLLTGDYPDWTRFAPVLLVLVGLLSVILGRTHARAVLEASWTGAGLAALLVFAVLQLSALFSRGALGPLGLSEFGPPALTSALVVTAWTAAGIAAGLLLTRLSQLQEGTEE